MANDSGKRFIYTVTSRFSLILDSTKYPPGELTIAPAGVIGEISNIPSVELPLRAFRYEGVSPGQCTIRDRDFVVKIDIVPLPD